MIIKRKIEFVEYLMRDSNDNNEIKKDLDETKKILVKIEEQLEDMFEYIKKMNK